MSEKEPTKRERLQSDFNALKFQYGLVGGIPDKLRISIGLSITIYVHGLVVYRGGLKGANAMLKGLYEMVYHLPAAQKESAE